MSGLSDLAPSSFGLGTGVLGTLQPGTRAQILDDNTGVAGAPVLSYAMPTPRTHPFAMLRTGHINMWGSSDFGAGAGGTNGIGFDATHPVPWTIVTGTTATGHVGITSGGGVNYSIFSATSHRRFHDSVFMIPTLSTVAQQFRVRFGWASGSFGVVTNGCYLEVDSSTNANAQFITKAAGVATTTDTGQVILAGVWYRVRITTDNAGPCDCFIVPEGTALTTPQASNNTNVPSGTGQAMAPNMLIEKLVGGTDRQLSILYTLTGMDRYAA